MDYFELSTFGAIAGTLSMLFVYIYLYALYRERYMGLWIISWIIFFSRIALFDSGFFNWKNSIANFIAYQIFYLSGAILTIYAINIFINKPLKKYWLYGAVAAVVFSMTAGIMQLSAGYKLAPLSCFATVMLFYVGKVFININTCGLGRYITGGAFILWSILTFVTPFFSYDNELPWRISLIGGILRFIITSGTLLVYFEKTRADLINEKKSLQESNQELNHFCHSVAHDLKSPLLSINQLAKHIELNYSDKFDNKGKEFFRHIQKKSADVINITDHLLELSRMSQKEMDVELINLESLFYEVYEELMKLQPSRQVVFTIKHLPDIYGDPVMIKILVINILTNALKYTRNRERAFIEVDSAENENDYIISVKDNGAGFDMRYSYKLFKIFERLHSVDEFEGTGIGLVVCQKILKRHCGKAWITGKVNEGATFFFCFPRNRQVQSSYSTVISPDTANQ
ncbi:Hypothetical protein LUCI_5066 [Lucifera butyrica]|uniref:histidine kinase n=1 Tax=Lucifera butyrica TaxID=1351585 RepID=A0A498RL32_9FIRM|nr:ATP-binding protein [Lucifera butyrica]VBB09768.1 Hypothetical protein LUCI_5066 [Lucifera butyrica]